MLRRQVSGCRDLMGVVTQQMTASCPNGHAVPFGNTGSVIHFFAALVVSSQQSFYRFRSPKARRRRLVRAEPDCVSKRSPERAESIWR